MIHKACPRCKSNWIASLYFKSNDDFWWECSSKCGMTIYQKYYYKGSTLSIVFDNELFLRLGPYFIQWINDYSYITYVGGNIKVPILGFDITEDQVKMLMVFQ